MENRAASLFILVLVLGVAGFCAQWEGSPEPQPASAPLEQFSAERALVHLKAFAKAPHPVGSAEHDRVRDYLVSQLTALGISPEIQRTTAVTPQYQVAGTIENIVARLKGTSGGSDAVALVAHYDSVPAGPGAGDDGAGVAALLETLRALGSGPPVRNDIIFLLTDGEEEGLLGASAFIAEHRWAGDARVVVNFEGRGNSGASQMFETSAGNGRLVQILAQAAPHPVSFSVSYEIYKHMPNNTDMTLFKNAGKEGLNFGFIGHWEAYHTPLDNPEQLSLASLQHHGENALSLARGLGNADLAQLGDRDAVYFSLPGGFFPRYSTRFVWPLAMASGVLLLAMIFYANGAFQTSFLGILGGFFAHLGLLVLLALTAFGFYCGVRWLHLHTLPEGDLPQNHFYVLGLLALLAAIQTTLYSMLRKKISPAAFFLGGSLLLFGLILVTAKWLPGGSYLFVWPLLAGLLATATCAFRPGRLSLPASFLLLILSLPALVFFAMLLQGLFTALGFSSLGAPLLSVTFGLFLVLFSPLLDFLLAANAKLVPLAALAAALCLAVAGARTTRYSPAHPKPSMLAYALDADTGKALWTSSAALADPWTAQFVSASPARGKLNDFYPAWLPIEFLQHEAPAVALLAPNAQLVEKSSEGATRTLHLHITSPRHGRSMHVGVAQAEVLDASVNGHDLGKPSEARWPRAGQWGFDYANPPFDGIDVRLRVQGLGQVTLVLVDRSTGLPSIRGTILPSRPADSMSHHRGDQTMVRRSFVF